MDEEICYVGKNISSTKISKTENTDRKLQNEILVLLVQ